MASARVSLGSLGLAVMIMGAGVCVCHAASQTPGEDAKAPQNQPSTGQQSASSQNATSSDATSPQVKAEQSKLLAGANSFTESQARDQIEKAGVNNVVNLKQDQQGIWRGQGQKSGRTVSVALDYRGNVVTQ